MENHWQLTDAEFEMQFANATFDPAIFSHEAHLRLAWIHLDRYGLRQAEENICQQLVNFVTTLGASDKFNKTLTVAAIKAVHHFMQKSQSDNFADFIEKFPRLKYNFKELIGYHYGFDIFESVRAKQEYLEPDLQPFD